MVKTEQALSYWSTLNYRTYSMYSYRIFILRSFEYSYLAIMCLVICLAMDNPRLSLLMSIELTEVLHGVWRVKGDQRAWVGKLKGYTHIVHYV